MRDILLLQFINIICRVTYIEICCLLFCCLCFLSIYFVCDSYQTATLKNTFILCGGWGGWGWVGLIPVYTQAAQVYATLSASLSNVLDNLTLSYSWHTGFFSSFLLSHSFIGNRLLLSVVLLVWHYFLYHQYIFPFIFYLSWMAVKWSLFLPDKSSGLNLRTFKR